MTMTLIRTSLRSALVASLESVQSDFEARALLETFNPNQPRDDQGQWVSSGNIKLAMGDPKLALSLRARVTNPKERAKLDYMLGIKPGSTMASSKTMRVTRKIKPAKSPSNDATKALRVARAKASHNPSSKQKQDLSEVYELRVAKTLGAVKSGDNKPMDLVINGKHGVEIKVLHDAKEGRVNMRPDSRKRKEAWASEIGGTVHTLLIDNRDKFEGGAHADKYSGHRYYIAEGAKAYRLNNMTPLGSLAEARSIITGARR